MRQSVRSPYVLGHRRKCASFCRHPCVEWCCVEFLRPPGPVTRRPHYRGTGRGGWVLRAGTSLACATGHVGAAAPRRLPPHGVSGDPRPAAAGSPTVGRSRRRRVPCSGRGALEDAGFLLVVSRDRCHPQPNRLPSWVVVHRAGAPIRGVQVVAGFPATPAWRTLLDLGCVAKAEAVERALDDALHRRLASLPQLRWALGAPGSPRHEGSRVLRHLLDARGPGYVPPESDLEGRLFAVLKAGGLPPGVRQYEVWDGRRWRRFDLAWPDHGLGIEVDGWESHGTRSSFQDDRARDRALQLRGWRVLRYTWDEVTAESEAMVEEIRRALLQTVS